MNARLSFSSTAARNNYEIALWARNLLDKDHLIDSVGSFPFTTNLAGHGEPLTYGVDVEYKILTRDAEVLRSLRVRESRLSVRLEFQSTSDSGNSSSAPPPP
jgi:hypothetical protein